ncbi:WXG100 family type VII secretion target [Prauserella cavernicola]|uniref:ESAT-6-like protein n=1 Tax=Prauserella cavernicola TaxID=2800127 RepID=A0A934QP26_9PSEU|nr:WXG100 family type VII secretion target [Prauserella cavernicola]MBK1783466.1 WXG100 family type VII secretion target [Prauserella cavernicola]
MTDAQVLALENHIDDTNSRIQGIMNGVQSQVAAVSAGWKGNSYNAFSAQQAAAQETATYLRAVLQQLREGVTQTRQEVTRGDDDGAAAARSINFDGGGGMNFSRL